MNRRSRSSKEGLADRVHNGLRKQTGFFGTLKGMKGLVAHHDLTFSPAEPAPCPGALQASTFGPMPQLRARPRRADRHDDPEQQAHVQHLRLACRVRAGVDPRTNKGGPRSAAWTLLTRLPFSACLGPARGAA